MANFFANLINKSNKQSIAPEVKNFLFDTPKYSQSTQAVSIGSSKKENFFTSLLNKVGTTGEKIQSNILSGPKAFKPTEQEKPFYESAMKKLNEKGAITAKERYIAITALPEQERKAIESVSKREAEYFSNMAIGATSNLPAGGKVVKTIGQIVGSKLSAGLKNIKVSQQATQKIAKVVEQIKPELEAIKGKKLTHEEVIEAAKTSNILKGVISRAQTLNQEAKILKTKQNLAALAEGKGVSIDFIENIKSIKSQATNAARILESFKTGTLPELAKTKSQMVKNLLDLGFEVDKIEKASKGVDFNDLKQVTKFYRETMGVKAKFGELLDEYRYINLLSSPKTQIVNTFSNILQTIINPTVKLYSGGIDYVNSALRGVERQHYISEVPAYTKGSLNSIGNAVSEAMRVLKGQQMIYRPDITKIPSGNKALAPFQIIPRLMEASDVFFRKIISGGEKEAMLLKLTKQGKTINESVLAKIDDEVAKKAEYWVFRTMPGAKGQGVVLSKIDDITKTMYRFGDIDIKGVKPFRWFVPFITTPMNILKQGLEFSPAGITTMVGHADKTEQLAKAMVGTTVTLGAGYLVLKGDSTWELPKDPKEKAYFYASGKQPYSIKIGNHWYNYSRLGAMAYPIALAAGINHYFKQNPQAATQSNIEKTEKLLIGIGGFFSDQSYVQGLGNLYDALSGDEYAVSQALANLPSQLVPLESLQRWVNSIIDPLYRQAEKGISVEAIIQNIQKNIIGMSSSLKPFKDVMGKPAKRPLRGINALSPVMVSEENERMDKRYDILMKQKERKAHLKELEEARKKRLGI